jgi:hypothetical protein
MIRPEAALAAALLVVGCAGTEAPLRRDLDALRAELAAARQENQRLQRAVEGLTARVDVLAARSIHPAAEAPRPEPRKPEAAAPVVPPEGLAGVRMEPPAPRARAAPPVPTAVAILEPEKAQLETLERRSGRGLAAEAEGELKAARRRDGLARAHALEDFVGRYPHHPQACGALVEAAGAYAEAGRPDAGCTLARRAADEYPAGEAIPEALWRVAGCESQRGSAEGELRILKRLVTEFPSTPAARRAGARLAAITGRGGEPPADDPARSSP